MRSVDYKYSWVLGTRIMASSMVLHFSYLGSPSRYSLANLANQILYISNQYVRLPYACCHVVLILHFLYHCV